MRHRPTNDAPPHREMDTVFMGVNMRLQPAELPPGYVSYAENMRFRNGVAETRLGMAKIAWLNKIVPGTPGIAAWSAIYGVGVFSDPVTQVEYKIIAAEGQVYACRANNVPTSIPLPVGVTITSAVTFTQCFNVLVMFRGADLPTLTMSRLLDGFSVPTQSDPEPVVPGYIEEGMAYLVTGGYVEYNSVTVSPGDQFTGVKDIVNFTADGPAIVTPAGGLVELPNAARGLFAANRLLVPHGSDLVAASDLLDYTRFTVFNDFRINQGSSDGLVTIESFGNNTVLALKENSVFRVDGVYGDLSQTQLSAVTHRYGCVAPKSAVDVGTDFLWLSQSGVASLTLTQQGEIQAGGNDRPPMFSDAIQPIIDRINWNYASGAVAKFHDNKLYLAVPLDDAFVVDQELVADGADYTSVQSIFLAPELNGTYYLSRGTNELKISNNGSFLDDYPTDGNVTFTTTPIKFTSNNAPSNDITSDVQKRVVGVNNAILVYDFLNRAWSGLDTFRDVGIKDMFSGLYNGRQRLFVTTTANLVFLYEEMFEDDIAYPYSDVKVINAVPNGSTFRINGGTLITASTGSVVNNLVGLWGVASTYNVASQNLFVDSNGIGFGNNDTWDKPYTRTAYITAGLRVISTNGLLPTIVKTGSWATQWDYTTTPIISTIITRGYTQGDPSALKRSVTVGLQLQTFNPTITYAVVREGVNQITTLVSAERRNRTVYDRPFDATAYDVTNLNDNFLTNFRQDYSVVFGDGFSGFQCRSGVQLGVHQEMRRELTSAAQARAPQIKLSNTTGRVRVLAGGLASFSGQQRKGAII